MLIACEDCHRQYDVGDFKPGARVRCVCGKLCEVPKVTSRQVQMLHCSNCGGALEENQGACSFCDSVVDRRGRASVDVCPECMRTLAEKAKFCNNCGVDIDPESVVRAVSDRGCPRCEQNLVLSTSDENSFYQCTGCAGLWLDRDHFEAFLAKHEEDAARPTSPRPGVAPTSVFPVYSYQELHRRESDPQVDLRCPRCRRVMARKRFAHYSAIYIDECFAHGFWIDDGEIQEILELVAVGGLEESRERYERSRARKRRSALRRRSVRRQNSAAGAGVDIVAAILLGLIS